MAEMRFFNYAKTQADADKIKTARMQNQLNVYKLEDATRIADKRRQADQIQRAYDDTPAQIDALIEKQLYGAAQELADAHINITRTRIDLVRSESLDVGKDEWDDYRYEKIQGGMPSWYLPEKYSPSFFESQLRSMKGAVTKISMKTGMPGDPNRVIAVDALYDKQGNIVTQGLPYTPAGSGGGGMVIDGIKASDANSINRAIFINYAGDLDPDTQKFSFADPRVRAKAVMAQELAQEIWISGTVRTMGAAVLQAMAHVGGLPAGTKITSQSGYLREDDPADLRIPNRGDRQPGPGPGPGPPRPRTNGPTTQEQYDASGRRLPGPQ